MDLPPELLDEIIGHLPPDDEKSLRSCSLVAKSWVHPSRRHLFETVRLSGVGGLGSWLATTPPTNVEIFQHVRSLTFHTTSIPDSPHGPAHLLHEHSSSFHRLERLTLSHGCPPSHSRIGTFAAFQHTLAYLCLWCCSVTASGLVTFVNYFPNLAHLEVGFLSRKADDQPTPPFSRPLQKLTVTEVYSDDGLGFIDQLMALHPQCDEVTVSSFWSSSPSVARCVIYGVEANVKRLYIKSLYKGVHSVLKILQ